MIGKSITYSLVALLTVRGDADTGVRGLTVTTRRVATSVWVIGAWSVTGSPDSVLTRLSAAAFDTFPAATLGPHRLRATVRRDSFSIAPPAPGLTRTGTFDAQSKRRGLLSTWATKAWSYTEPDQPPPAPVIDSIFVRPVSFTVEATVEGVPPGPENQHPVCALVGFRGGHVGFRRVHEGTIAYCDSTYKALPAAARAVTPTEQAIADGVCVDWSKSTGGTVTPELCPSNPAVRFAPGWQFRGATVHIRPASPAARAQGFFRRPAS